MRCDRCGKNEATFYYKSNINGQGDAGTPVSPVRRGAGLHRLLPLRRYDRRPVRRFLLPSLRDAGAVLQRGWAPACSPSSLNRWMCWGRRGRAHRPRRTPATCCPGTSQDALTRQRRRNALQTQLNLAVQEERFEEAAKLRDELKALEK